MDAHDLDHRILEPLVAAWLTEDVGRGDVTTDSVVAPDALGRAYIEAREPALIAGLEVARICFATLDDGVTWDPQCADGKRVEAGDTIAFVSGRLRSILTAERCALNALARLCGVATLTSRYVDAVSGTHARVVDTRKTTPGLRSLEKYAVRVGGGHNHRFGLDDGVLIKDNHIAAARGVAEAIRRARAGVHHGFRIEVEVTDESELRQALEERADVILLDNMSSQEVARAVEIIEGRAVVEVSGGIDLDTIRDFAEAGADLISVGALTHSAPTIDIALEVEA